MKIRFLLLSFIVLFSTLFAKEFKVNSPDKKLEVKIFIDKNISYSVSKNGYEILVPSQISMTLYDGTVLGNNPKVKDSQTETINQKLTPVVKQKYSAITDNCEQLTLRFDGNYSLVFRVYNDGVAYRFKTSFEKDITIKSEQVEFNFGKDYEILFPEEESFMSQMERMYLPIKLSEVTPKRFCLTPALVKLDNNYKMVITEADLEDYCGMYLTKNTRVENGFAGLFPAYPAKDSIFTEYSVYVVERKDYLAKTPGTKNFPWRVMIISEKDGDLIESTMIYKLAKPSDPKIDFSWVKPGKVAWDWWSFNNIFGVDFKAGINNETYKYYIDFASKYGIEYVALDEGWYQLESLLKESPGINVKELVDYAKTKNVKIILWVIWKKLDEELQPALDLFEKWGVAGIKVDFMQRDDQPMVQYFYKITEEAAKRKLIVDFHGAYKPTGLYRTFPNVITNEGVKGLENNKASEDASPWMAVTIPFIRMVAGPMDYTPGAMRNSTEEAFCDIWNSPMSQGTRCHQLAMYVNFESPLQMLADSPSNYYKESECMEFLAKVPSVWDDTKVLDAQISEYVLTARRNGKEWYVGAMTNWTPRDLTVDFSFLPEGKFKINIWQDGINADRYASDYKKVSQTVDKNTKLNIHLAPGGGWAAILSVE